MTGKRQAGFTYIGPLIFVAAAGTGLAAYAEIASHVEAPDGGVMGVYSRSEEAPIKTANFSSANAAFEKARTYTDWKFVHSPTGLVRGIEKSTPK